MDHPASQESGMNKPLLAVASMAEALTGVGLLVAPSLLTRMLFGAEVADVGAVISRIAGISLDQNPSRRHVSRLVRSFHFLLCGRSKDPAEKRSRITATSIASSKRKAPLRAAARETMSLMAN